MNATISTGVFIASAILVMLLVPARLAVQSYGHRIGTDDAHYNQLPDPEHKHSRYANLQRFWTIASIAVGVWIILLGARMTLGASTELNTALQQDTHLAPGRLAGALGMAVVLAGIGLIVIQSTLRWDHRPEQILNPRLAFKSLIVRKTSTHSERDFSALMQASGDSEKPPSAAHWYGANSWALLGMLGAVILVFLCYLALFIIPLP